VDPDPAQKHVDPVDPDPDSDPDLQHWGQENKIKLWVMAGAGSQMVVASLSGEDDRAGALARLGVSYGLGKQIKMPRSFYCSE
jgi:hypothetical protein